MKQQSHKREQDFHYENISTNQNILFNLHELDFFQLASPVYLCCLLPVSGNLHQPVLYNTTGVLSVAKNCLLE